VLTLPEVAVGSLLGALLREAIVVGLGKIITGLRRSVVGLVVAIRAQQPKRGPRPMLE